MQNGMKFVKLLIFETIILNKGRFLTAANFTAPLIGTNINVQKIAKCRIQETKKKDAKENIVRLLFKSNSKPKNPLDLK